MVHQYQYDGQGVVMDTCSGAVHLVDDVAYDIIEMWQDHTPEEIERIILERYGDREDVTPEDVRECLNDAYLALWRGIPPERPRVLGAYIHRVVRNLSLKRYRYNEAAKRSSQVEESWEELAGTLCTAETVESAYSAKELSAVLNAFLRKLEEEPRRLFIRRYWYFDSIAQLAQDFEMSESKVKSMLFRLRNRLRDILRKEGYDV